MNSKMSRNRNTRVVLFQVLLPASFGDVDFNTTKDWLREGGYLETIDKKRFYRWLGDIVPRLTELDSVFEPHLQNRALTELGHAECAILRIATYELTCTEVPYPVTINEWVDIAKEYGAENSFRFVNGVLDKIAAAQRANVESHE